MNAPTKPSRSTRSRAACAIVATAATALLLATACSSADDVATPTTAPPTTIAPPTTTAPPATTASPTTVAPPTTTASPDTGPPSTSAADAAREAQLTGILETHRAAGEFVGARIALADRDGTVTEVTAGTTTTDPASAPVDLDVAWNIGSVTKTFVAVVVLQLADEGRIDLDAGIGDLVPELRDADRITVRQLLQHTSGLGEYNDQRAVLDEPLRQWTPAELVAVAEAAGRVGEPGGPFHYSNTNYIVLGEIIERVTGHSWADEVRTRIAEPLGLTHTGVIGTVRPAGFQVVDGSFVDVTGKADPSIGGAAGAMESTGRDLLRFAKALTDGTLLSATSQAAMQTFIPGDDYSQFGIVHSYGLGLERYSDGTITVDGHMGTGEVQSAFLGYDVQHGTAVAVMTNTAVAGPQAFMAFEALTAVSAVG